ncbi:hypothetical protein MKO06_10950 [Gramella sp. GC03-9]|uniref:DUF3575 domain-containing protein n=1 Tax=Christiangramia oceanisediminis TaxID=2920386 RepID=A0A9X2KYK2_9FLAO|nr:hypothetical protein [Gramella oceanisediminis]MCP9200431.1 hypothetical protein [Gramella oceanisediminis]
MKKLAIAGILLLSTSICLSQENLQEEEPEKRDITQNELSLNAFNLVSFGVIEVAYERVISENSTWAVEAFIHPNKEDYVDELYYKDLSLTGKYKHFFSSTYARGFYVNGFGMISSGEYETESYWTDGDYIVETDDYADFAIGFGLGGKFVSSGGFLLDLNAGIGRNLLSNNSPTIVGQFMVNLGFRF